MKRNQPACFIPSAATVRKRRPPLANSLLQSAISHMHTAVEFFNRPTQPHRYEIAAELALAAWEKLLKAYLHRAKHNIFHLMARQRISTFVATPFLPWYCPQMYPFWRPMPT